jgi:hypothetical protein
MLIHRLNTKPVSGSFINLFAFITQKIPTLQQCNITVKKIVLFIYFFYI